jgi:hypothetical protein
VPNVPPQRPLKKKPTRNSKKGKPAKYNPRRPSANFAALIAAVQSEGIAYRKEEQSEDRGKRLREWITISLVALTLIAVVFQVHEMIKVYVASAPHG